MTTATYAEQPLPSLQEYVVELAPAVTNEARGGTQRIGLEEALDVALAQNLELALARADERVARGERLEAEGALYPFVAVGGNVGRKDGRVQGSFGNLLDVSFSTYQAGLGLGYDANLGARIAESLAERKNLRAASLQVLSVEQRLLLRVVEFYQDLSLATVGVRIAEDVAQWSEQFVTIVAARAEGGLGLGADVARARAKLASDKQQLVQAHNLLQHVSSRLVHVLQLDAATLLEPAENRLRPQRYLHAIPTITSSDFGLNARPDVQEANERVRAAKDYASSAMWELFSPELRAELGHVEIGRSSDDLGGRDQWGALLLWTLSVDEVGQLRKRKAEEQAARLRSLRVSDLARHEIRNAARDLDAAAERIPLAGSGLEAAQSNLRLSEARFKAGAAIMLEVLDAQNVLADAHLNLARAIVAYNSSQARLLAATGAITRASFGAAGGYATDPASR